mmetsp:Transcript_62618/g.135962  ORF Transcript_62618/g.135962 Transcript_62618/m.135962 type:complete len:111 (-) Transcript_62618:408-740(-)
MSEAPPRITLNSTGNISAAAISLHAADAYRIRNASRSFLAPEVTAAPESISQGLFLVGVFVFLHVALCIGACGYWALAVFRDLQTRPQPTYLSNARDGKLHNLVEEKKAS